MTEKANQKKIYRPRIKGICKAADDLGYSYRHLAKVLRGERHSPKALRAYRAYKHDKQEQGQNTLKALTCDTAKTTTKNNKGQHNESSKRQILVR